MDFVKQTNISLNEGYEGNWFKILKHNFGGLIKVEMSKYLFNNVNKSFY